MIWLAELSVSGSGNPLAEYGTPVGMALLLAVLWEKDRKSRIKAQEDSDARYGKLTEKLIDVVEANTKSSTKLDDSLRGVVVDCPLLYDDSDTHRKLVEFIKSGALK
jgi:hypothetical protein